MNLFKKILKQIFLFLLIIYVIASCSVVKQGKQMSVLAKCEFRIISVTNLYLAGRYVQDMKGISDMNLTDAREMVKSVAGSTLPLSFILNVEARNPNTEIAGMNKLEWILFIDDIQMITGSVDKQVLIPAKDTAIIPVQMDMDLKQILHGKTVNAMINFGFNIAGVGKQPTRLTIKLKPTIMIGSKPVVYPGYLTVKTEFVSQ